MNQDKQHGFTLIELMLAMGFVSALLLAVAMTVIQIGNIYNRGLTLKDVNQAGRSLSSELQRSIAASEPFDLSDKFINESWGGRLCTGQYTYVWNYGEALLSTNPNYTFRNVYKNANPSPNEEIHFIKVIDPSASYCSGSAKQVIDNSSATELLNVGQHNLAIHYFDVSSQPSASDGSIDQQLYSIVILIGTNDQSALTGVLSTKTCKLPGVAGADLSYCSVNQFNIVARAGNSVD